MIVFVDFEASSLNKKSYPIEVAWVFEDGKGHTSLIRPAPAWDDWSAEAEAIHGITREQLNMEGVAVDQIATTMVGALSAHEIYASAPSWDGKWLSTLLRAGGHPRHALRVRKSDDVFFDVAKHYLGAAMTDHEIAAMVEQAIEETEPLRPSHRALPDAQLELERLHRVRRLANPIKNAVSYPGSL